MSEIVAGDTWLWDEAAEGLSFVPLDEHQTRRNVPLTPVQAVLLRERFGKYIAIQPAWEGDGYDLTPGGFVGDIVLGTTRLHIRPKVPIRNLFYMLTYAANLAQFRDEATTLAAADDLFEFVVKIFARQVDTLVRNGIARGYIEIDDSAPFLRGRLHLAEQLRRHLTRPGRFEQRLTEFTADMRENRILKATLGRLVHFDYRDDRLRPLLRRALSAFSEVTLCDVRPEECDRVIYTRLNQRYRSPLALARLFLQHLSLESHQGGTSFAAFLLPVHKVFEGFVSAFLTQAVAGRPEWRVAPQYHYTLDTGGRLPVRPDNVLYYEGKPVHVVDTKYKVFGEKPSADDIAQMIAYCVTLNVPRALLLYPNDQSTTDHFQIKGGIEVEAQAVSLAGSLAGFQHRWQQWADDLSLRTTAQAKY